MYKRQFQDSPGAITGVVALDGTSLNSLSVTLSLICGSFTLPMGGAGVEAVYPELHVAGTGGVTLRRFVEAEVSSSAMETLDRAQVNFQDASADGTLLVSGGRGGLGMLLAEWAGLHGAQCILLMGRSAPKATDRDLAARLRNAGVLITSIMCDAGDAVAVRRAVDLCVGGVSGVIHAAGIVGGNKFADLDAAAFKGMIDSKGVSAWNLHRSVEDMPLSLFFMTSSTGSSLPQPGQVAYAAGNGFLESLGALRRGAGLTGLSVGFGPLAEVGELAELEPMRAFLSKTGLAPMTNAAVLAAVEAALSRSDVAATLIAAEISWSRVLGFMSWTESMALVVDRPAASVGAGVSGVSEADVSAWLVENLANYVSEAPETVDLHKPFNELGLGSLGVVSLATDLAAFAGASVAATTLYDLSLIHI